jgi:small subunit ribosomal protein S8
MSQTDPIADFLTRIRNAIIAQQDEVEMPASNFKAELARILHEQGYIEDFAVEPAPVGRILRIRLKYTDDRKSVISGLERLSRPGRRNYVSADDVPRVLGGMGTAIMSTSRGVMTGHDARRTRVGGELVAKVW